MQKPILVSGIQPTGKLHIGNYLGALKNFVELQNSGKYDCYFFIADLHALTENPEPKDLRTNIIGLAADFFAAGLDLEKSIIFQQSQISAHTKLTWILNTIIHLGELRRMTQFKDKASLYPKIRTSYGEMYKSPLNDGISAIFDDDSIEVANVGLFTYPTLMAADVLLYNAGFVPVGNDQLQHLELARTITRKFNKRFGKTFVEPHGLHTKTPRVMSLKNPEKKMSKSQPDGCVFIDDSPEEIKRKISHAVTDSGTEVKYDPEKKAGLSNLLEIYSALSGEEIKKIEKQFAGKSYSEFKSALARLIADHFANFREKKKGLLAKPRELVFFLHLGSKRAAAVAEKKMQEVKKKIGIAI